MKCHLCFFVLFSFIGCAPEFYAPNRIHIPELKQKGDVRLSGATGYLQIEAQFAYALTNNIGILSNFANYGSSTDETGFDEGGGGGIEFGAGYFFSKRNIIIENYATIGFGSFYNNSKYVSPFYPDDDGKLNSNFTKLSLQSSLTYQHSLFSVGVACRLSNLTYNDIKGNYTKVSANLGSYLRSNPIHYFVEPAIQIGAGFKNIRLNLQYQHSHHLNSDRNYYYTDYNYSAGIQLSFPAIRAKKKDEIKPI